MNAFVRLFTNTMTRRTQDEDFLSRATTIADCERRQRELLRARFAGW